MENWNYFRNRGNLRGFPSKKKKRTYLQIQSKLVYKSNIIEGVMESEIPLEYYQNGSFKMWR